MKLSLSKQPFGISNGDRSNNQIQQQRQNVASSSLLATSGFFSDSIRLLSHISLCVIVAITLCRYEDFDCQALKPNVHLRPVAIRGMGEGANERLLNWRVYGEQQQQQDNYYYSQRDWIMKNINNNNDDDDDDVLQQIPSYNEVMFQHRQERVANWKILQQQHDEKNDKTTTNNNNIQASVDQIVTAIHAILKLKVLVQDYDWSGVREAIRQPNLTMELERACATLQSSIILSPEARDEIGFHWGSCAWRHCGAQADAQEALAELYNLSGVLEPFEGLFILDIVERSLRDILAVIPSDYHDEYFNALAPYQPYQSSSTTTSDGNGEESGMDAEYMATLERFKQEGAMLLEDE